MAVESFADIEQEFQARVARIAWCTVCTVDTLGRPRSRILHPIWEGSTGWIMTGRSSVKAKHIEGNPYVSCSYWDQQHQQIYVDARAGWEDGIAEKKRIWRLFETTPPPLGYDPAQFFKAPEDPSFGLLRLVPWRIELWSLQDLTRGRRPQVWRAGDGAGR